MIPVQLQPEPEDFDKRVRTPGKQFRAEVPTPTTKQWEGKEYWRRALPHMRKAYKSICAYSAHWIPYGTGNHSIDHFVPRFQESNLAYEWSNFRYVAARFNSRKGTQVILDPFALLPNWFIIDFRSLFVKPNPDLLPSQKEEVLKTIKYLKLNNDDDLVAEREAWVQDYYNGDITFLHLEKKAPLIAYELKRQGLLNK